MSQILSVKALQSLSNSPRMPPSVKVPGLLDCLKLLLEGFPSGQRDQTVNLTRELRWFESTPLHHFGACQQLANKSLRFS